jgi:hypothetical protein
MPRTAPVSRFYAGLTLSRFIYFGRHPQSFDAEGLFFYETADQCLVPAFVILYVSSCPHQPKISTKCIFVFFGPDWKKTAHKFSQALFDSIQAELEAKDPDEFLCKPGTQKRSSPLLPRVHPIS